MSIADSQHDFSDTWCEKPNDKWHEHGDKYDDKWDEHDDKWDEHDDKWDGHDDKWDEHDGKWECGERTDNGANGTSTTLSGTSTTASGSAASAPTTAPTSAASAPTTERAEDEHAAADEDLGTEVVDEKDRVPRHGPRSRFWHPHRTCGFSREGAWHGEEGAGGAHHGEEGAGGAHHGEEGAGGAHHGEEGAGGAHHGAHHIEKARGENIKVQPSTPQTDEKLVVHFVTVGLSTHPDPVRPAKTNAAVKLVPYSGHGFDSRWKPAIFAFSFLGVFFGLTCAFALAGLSQFKLEPIAPGRSWSKTVCSSPGTQTNPVVVTEIIGVVVESTSVEAAGGRPPAVASATAAIAGLEERVPRLGDAVADQSP